jgi:hypothetical protein
VLPLLLRRLRLMPLQCHVVPYHQLHWESCLLWLQACLRFGCCPSLLPAGWPPAQKEVGCWWGLL